MSTTDRASARADRKNRLGPFLFTLVVGGMAVPVTAGKVRARILGS